MGVSLLAATSYLARGYVMDDALITLRYSHHLAESGIAYWNPAQRTDPVQGFTTLLWMAVNALPGLFTDGRDAFVGFARALAFFSAFGALVVFLTRMARDGAAAGAAIAVVALLFAQPAFGFHVQSAMETWTYGALLLLAVHLHVTGHAWSRKIPVAVLACWTRPEGALALAAILAHDAWRRRWKDVVPGAAVAAVGAAVSLGIGHFVYGSLLPNAFYRKQATALDAEALRYTLFFFATLAIVPLLLALRSAWRDAAGARFALLIAAAYIAYFCTVKPWMNVFARFQWAPYLLLLYASLPTLVDLHRGRRERPWRWAAVVAAFLLLAAGNLVGVHYQARGVGRALENSSRIGRALHALQQPHRWLVYHDAGAICFYSDWNCYETIALNLSEDELRRWPLDQALDDPRVVLYMQNLRGQRLEDELPRLADELRPHGFDSTHALATLRQGGQRGWYIAAFVKTAEAPEVDRALRDLRLEPETGDLWSWSLYRRARRLLKGDR